MASRRAIIERFCATAKHFVQEYYTKSIDVTSRSQWTMCRVSIFLARLSAKNPKPYLDGEEQNFEVGARRFVLNLALALQRVINALPLVLFFPAADADMRAELQPCGAQIFESGCDGGLHEQEERQNKTKKTAKTRIINVQASHRTTSALLYLGDSSRRRSRRANPRSRCNAASGGTSTA